MAIRDPWRILRHGKGPDGAAYVFVQGGASWIQQAELGASNGTPLNLFGGTVALSGNMAAVSGLDPSVPGQAVYVFARSGSTWGQKAELTANTAGSGNFGSALAINDDGVVLAGDASYPVNGNEFQGDAYVFTPGSPAASSSSASSSAAASSGTVGGSGPSASASGSAGGSSPEPTTAGAGGAGAASGAPTVTVLHGWGCRAAGPPDEGGIGAWLAVLGLAAVARRRASRAS